MSLTKRETEILTRLAQIIPQIPETKQERVLGVAEGMCEMKVYYEEKAQRAG